MPHSRVSGVVVTHVWDDGSEQNYTLTSSKNDQGFRVEISDGGDLIHLYKESWDEIRDQIDGLFEQAQEGE